MGVFTFVCKSSGGSWNAKQFNGDLEGSGDSTYALQRNLVNVSLSADNSGCGVQSSFSHVLPDSGVFQVIIGGSGDGASFGAASAPSGGAAAAEALAAEEKKEEIVESDEEDYAMNLFDD